MDEKEKVSKLSLLFADSIMTENVQVIPQSMMIGQVAHLMLRERVSAYPVVDKDENVVGIVTLTDLFALINNMVIDTESLGSEKTLEAQIADFKAKPITTLMSKNVMAVPPDISVEDILRAVVKHNIHTFPVMENNKLVGIISRHDILNAVFVYG